MKSIVRYKITLILACLLIITGCERIGQTSRPAAVQEIAPEILEGYLAPEEMPDSLALLPVPPAEESAAFALDKEVSQESLALRGTPRWNLAAKDANLEFPEAANTFSDALGFRITKEKTPYLYMLLSRTLTDAGLSTYAAKNHYSRIRPFMENNQPVCTPDYKENLRKDGSYPSGHTAIGWAWALILCEIVPERTDAIISRGRDFGHSRCVCNVHWQSDINEGRFMGAAIVARLHADKGFQRDLEKAKAEVKWLLAR